VQERLELPPPPPLPEEKPPPVKKPRPVRVEKEGPQEYIILNFDNADIESVIATFGELLGINYILSPGIKGQVTIQSYRRVPMKDLFRIFQSILELNGLTAVKDGPLYRIVPLDTARQQPLEVKKDTQVEMTLDASFITQLVPLQYVKASEIVGILRRLAPRGTDIIVYEPANLLILTALPHTLLKFMKILEALDVAETERETVRTFVYYVENGEAEELAKILKEIYPEKEEAPRPARPAAAQPTRRVVRRPQPPAPAVGIAAEVGKVTITAYKDINALIIKCTPRTYLSVLELLKKLDVPPKQVLIEVLVAEVTLTDVAEFGLQWLFKRERPDLAFTGTSTVTITEGGGVVLGPALTGGRGITGLVTAVVDSLLIESTLQVLASEGRLNVLASPHILAMDNKEAKIEVGSEEPVATGLIKQPETGTLSTQAQVQYRTVGTILTVTPRITEKNKVTLEITQEVSQVNRGAATVLGETFDSFNTRKATTTAVVESGKTLLIGGLIRESDNFRREGIPVLSKIPLIGYLFSTTTRTKEKTELVVMVTPHVIGSQEEADRIAQEFQNRVRLIRESLKIWQKQPKAEPQEQ
jgi:general secretion pathway protein D